jgi:hypothetical protein
VKPTFLIALFLLGCEMSPARPCGENCTPYGTQPRNTFVLGCRCPEARELRILKQARMYAEAKYGVHGFESVECLPEGKCSVWTRDSSAPKTIQCLPGRECQE